MHEFNNRVEAQRTVLSYVNAIKWDGEELFGLSKKAINRWTLANHLQLDNPLVQLVMEVSSNLFFLANKSQEQVDAAYTVKVHRVSELADSIRILSTQLRT